MRVWAYGSYALATCVSAGGVVAMGACGDGTAGTADGDSSSNSATSGASSSGAVGTGGGASGTGGAGGSGGLGGMSGLCTPGAIQSCYSGPALTEGVGLCTAGTQTCASDGMTWGACIGEALPLSADDCSTPDDDNCDGEVNDACLCTPNEVTACYTGPMGTQGVGLCAAGQHTCSMDGKSYGPCTGEVLPAAPTCTLPLVDEDCDGTANNGCCVTGTWTFETVDTVGGLGTVRALHVDDQWGVHMLYEPKGLSTAPQPNEVRYAYKPRGGAWTTEVIAAFTTQTVTPLDMALDSSGTPHVFYREGTSTRYATRTMMTWSTEVVPGISSPSGAGIGVDGAGEVHGVFRTGSTVRRAQRNTMAAWSVTNLMTSTAGTRVEAAMATDGRFHMLFTEPACTNCTANDLWYRSVLQGSVTAPNVLSQAASQNPIGIDLDPNGHPRVAYRSFSSNVAVGAFDGMSWNTTVCVAPTCPTSGNWLATAVDESGDQHLAYASGFTTAPFTRLIHVRFSNGTWTSHEVTPISSLATSIELDVDASGGAHVAYALQGGTDLVYGYRCP